MSITNIVPLNWYSSMKKKIKKDSDNFWHRKLNLKVRNWHFLIAWFRADVDLTKEWQKNCYFSLNWATIWCGSWWKILKCYLINSANAVFTLHTDEILTIKVVRPPPDATTYTDYLRAHDVTIHRQPIEVSIALFFKRILEIFRFYLRWGHLVM